MTLPTFQQTVSRFVQAHNLEAPVHARLLDLTSEVGELAKEALKGSNYGHESFQPTASWESELADGFFSLICLANSTGVNMEAALAGALEKYQARLAAAGDSGSGR
ncbi:MAG: nucleotide pyrophosphohydrolase [Chloroflexi bacterium]|nr:nucleotide pyrophosphohydrolase [Chloroflexota bacterium]